MQDSRYRTEPLRENRGSNRRRSAKLGTLAASVSAVFIAIGVLSYDHFKPHRSQGRTDAERTRSSATICAPSTLLGEAALHWEELPLSSTAGLLKVCFVDPATGWAAGENGAILHTVDGGRSWTTQQSGTELALFDLQFFDRNVGYAIGGSSQLEEDRHGTFSGHYASILLRTDDGGQTWRSVNIPSPNLHWSLSFVDAETGWLVGWNPSAFNQTVVYRSTDGGSNWEPYPVEIDPDGVGITDITRLSVIDRSDIWGVGSSLVRRSADAGATWDVKYRKKMDAHDPAGLESVQFIDSSSGWALGRMSDSEMGNYSFMIRTTDGGNTWQGGRNTRGEVLTSFMFLDRCVGVAAARTYGGKQFTFQAGAVEITTDGGETWRQTHLQKGEFFRSVFTLKDGTCWVLGRETLLRCKLPLSTG